VTRDATAAAGSSAACSGNVRAAWDAMFTLAATAQGLQQLSQLFATCRPLQSLAEVQLLAALYINAWDTLAMGNFPYPSNYLSGSVNLPAWPFRYFSLHSSNPSQCTLRMHNVTYHTSHARHNSHNLTQRITCLMFDRVACDFLDDPSLSSRPVALLQAFVAAAGVFNNCTQDVQASVRLTRLTLCAYAYTVLPSLSATRCRRPTLSLTGCNGTTNGARSCCLRNCSSPLEAVTSTCFSRAISCRKSSWSGTAAASTTCSRAATGSLPPMAAAPTPAQTSCSRTVSSTPGPQPACLPPPTSPPPSKSPSCLRAPTTSTFSFPMILTRTACVARAPRRLTPSARG
jgi:hypothetical protein